MSIITPGEPAAEVQEAPTAEAAPEGQAVEGEGTVEEAVASNLPDDTMLELEAPDGTKTTVSLKELRQTYIDRDRHRKAADQKFTEADKARKGVQAAVVNAIKDPTSFLKWMETQRPDFKTVDFFFEQLERDGNPQVIDRLAQLLEKKLKAEETEQALSPADKRVRELEKQNEELRQQWEQHQDDLEERSLFDGVKGAIEAAGLNPTPLVGVMALEIIAEAREKGIDLSHEEAANILKEQVSSAAERLFKPAAEGKDALPPRGPDGKFQAPAKAAPGAADAGTVAQAKRQARATVVKQPNKKKNEGESEPMSFLEAIRQSYSSV